MNDSTIFDSYLPIYNTLPDDWKDAQSELVECLKKISDMTNIREIGWYLDEELLTGKQFIPSVPNADYRSIFRMVVNTGALVAGVNSIPHGITFDSSFTLIHLYGGATNSNTLVAEPIPNNSMTISMNSTNLLINADQGYTRSYVIIEYLKEV